MTCRQYQFLIGTEEESALAANADLQAHIQSCADCAQLAEEMRALSQAMAMVPPLPAPASFADRVRSQVRETEQVRSQSLVERLLGPLRAPAPALQPRQALAAAAIIMVALVLLTMVVHPLGLRGPNPNVNVPSVTQPGGGQPVLYQPSAGAQPGQTTESSQAP